jgi:hypothetical protein
MSGYIGNIPVPEATQTRDVFTATSGQTVFPTSGYSPGYLDVYLNGVHLDPSDYTATNGSDVVLDVGAAAGDSILVVAFATFNVLGPDLEATSVTADTIATTGGADLDTVYGWGDHSTEGYATETYADTAEADARSYADGIVATEASARATGDSNTLTSAQSYTDTAISNLVDSAPAALDTLNELSAALGDDANFATTVTNSLATKANSVDVYTKTQSDARYEPIDSAYTKAEADARYEPIDSAYTKAELNAGQLDNRYYTETEVDGLLGSIDATNLKDSSDNVVVDASSGNMVLGDNKKAIFGAGSDLEVYHNGSHSVIDNNTGNLYVLTDGTTYFANSANNENYATFNQNGACSLYYDNAAKLATTSTGVSVTGTVAATSFTGDGSALTGLAASFADLTDTTVSTSDPSSATNPSATGHIWVNKTTGECYVCTDATTGANTWINIGAGSGNIGGTAATGGTVSTVSGYKYHTFTSSGTLTFTKGGTVEYLIVAGGGGTPGSNNTPSGGGGAGGMITGSFFASATAYSVVVGSGGSGGAAASNTATSGGSSSIFSLTATGGGKGAWDNTSGASGGSGGGGSLSGSGGSGTSGQGNAGGNGSFAAGQSAGGGGGKGTAGANSTTGGGNGGAGAQWLNGNYYAGGGGGGSWGTSGTGGIGGGGNAGASAQAGTANTGGGGGGAGGGGSVAGANGGSGIVIIRYPI